MFLLPLVEQPAFDDQHAVTQETDVLAGNQDLVALGDRISALRKIHAEFAMGETPETAFGFPQIHGVDRSIREVVGPVSLVTHCMADEPTREFIG